MTGGEWITVEGDAHKVEPTRRYFAEIRASLKNALDVERELRAEVERLTAEVESLRAALPAGPDGDEETSSGT